MIKKSFTKIKYIKNGLYTLYSANCPFGCEYEDSHTFKQPRKVGSFECLTCMFFIAKNKDIIECFTHAEGFGEEGEKKERKGKGNEK